MSRRGVVFAIVLLALGVRGLQAVLVPALPADAIEYQNVADNLRAGRGFVLDVKPYHAYDGPVVQYSGYVRPPGLPVLLATLQTALPRPLVSTWIGPVLVRARAHPRDRLAHLRGPASRGAVGPARCSPSSRG